MPSKKSDDQKLANRATDLYWNSGQSVNQIAEAMDLSKSGLYAIVRPLSADRPCPDCGDGLVFPNRTAKQKAIGSCLACGYTGGKQAEGPDADAQALTGGGDSRPRERDSDGEGSDLTSGEVGSDLVPTASGLARGKTSGWKSNRTLWAAVLFGVAAGLYVTRRPR